ncbi:MAG: GNAT family N-acetyltransferase [Cyanobacteria bacterium J06628_6]
MIEIREMILADHEQVVTLLTETSGVTLREADGQERTGAYLARNPGLSFVARSGNELVGMVMCGHDGRRGYLQHLLVKPAYRGQGIAQLLVQYCLDALEAIGILKIHLFVLKENERGAAFWRSQGWQQRADVTMYSFNRSGNPNT